jgi:transketolase
MNMHVEGVDEHVQLPDPKLEPLHEARLLLPSLKALRGIEQTPMRGWPRWLGEGGAIDGAHTFGASAPPRPLIQKFGFTPGVVARIARERVALACKE